MELFSTTSGHVTIITLVLTNLWAFFMMAHDKRKSAGKNNVRRTPEGKIFFMATMLGGVGVYLGMHAFRHKTKKWYFQLGIPLLIVQNLATIYVLLSLIQLP